jgi:hypothetical protein
MVAIAFVPKLQAPIDIDATSRNIAVESRGGHVLFCRKVNCHFEIIICANCGELSEVCNSDRNILIQAISCECWVNWR